MIVKVFKAHPAGTGRPLTTYVLAAKHEHSGDRLGSYIRDPTKDKVAWDRTINCGVDDPFQAIGAIERYNARNTRAHRKSRWEHIVVSFPDGERPTRSRMEIIEDRLMASIGFGDHPRISAVHHDTLHSHLHIAVSRIDPTTLHAEHPRFSRFRLQAEAARLEIELGLRQERKTLQLRERAEIDSRLSIDRAVTARHSQLEPEEPALKSPTTENDRYPNPVPSLQQIARELSPEYDKLLRRADEITHKIIPKDEWVIRQQEGDLREAEHRLAERKDDIGWLRRALHTTHLWRDRELERWGPDFKARKEHTLWKWQAQRAAHLGEWKTLIRQADPVFEAIRPRAESLLAVRQMAHQEKIAQQAREFLATTDRVTINRRRSHTLRSGP